MTTPTPPPDRIPEPSEADILKLCDELDQESREADERNEGTYRTKMPIQTETLRILTVLVRRCHAAERAILERDLLSSRARAAEASTSGIELAREEWVCGRLIDWILNDPRKPANTAFTSGPARQVAYRIEDLLRAAEAERDAFRSAGERRTMERDAALNRVIELEEQVAALAGR